MSDSHSGSKRVGLRFNGAAHGIRYKTEFEDGNGTIDNISTGGCALAKYNVPLNINERILLILQLENDDSIEISARIVRVEATGAAAQFENISEEKKQQIVKYFARKQRENGA